ncbi:MAG: hypothetical protein JKY15_04495 [Deltaproteobacteria bacterium]|nr:hypothetical protein [Deltaproteobacteria bacterium]
MHHFANSLLGPDNHKRWLSEIHGPVLSDLSSAATQKIQSHMLVAYLDPFDNLAPNSHPSELLLLKPKTLKEALAMTQELLKNAGLHMLIIDSLFWFDAKLAEFEQALKALDQMGNDHKKRILLVNPENGVRKYLEPTLEAFCESVAPASEPGSSTGSRVRPGMTITQRCEQ